MTGSFLEEPAVSPPVQALYEEDLAESGYVWNVSRLWAHQPGTLERLFELMSQAFKESGLHFRQRGILVAAAVSALGDSYCSLAWGGKLAGVSEPALAAGVLSGDDAGLTDQERAIAAWARKVVKGPNATTAADVQALRDTGLTDGQIFAITAFVALRLAFSTVNDALGAGPDPQLVAPCPKKWSKRSPTAGPRPLHPWISDRSRRSLDAPAMTRSARPFGGYGAIMCLTRSKSTWARIAKIRLAIQRPAERDRSCAPYLDDLAATHRVLPSRDQRQQQR